jgi:ABC-type transporter Mla subunit MlaD
LELQKLQWDRELVDRSTVSENAEQSAQLDTLQAQLTEVTEECSELKRQLIDGTVALATLDQQVTKANAVLGELLQQNRPGLTLSEEFGMLDRLDSLRSFLTEAQMDHEQLQESARVGAFLSVVVFSLCDFGAYFVCPARFFPSALLCLCCLRSLLCCSGLVWSALSTLCSLCSCSCSLRSLCLHSLY